MTQTFSRTTWPRRRGMVEAQQRQRCKRSQRRCTAQDLDVRGADRMCYISGLPDITLNVAILNVYTHNQTHVLKVKISYW